MPRVTWADPSATALPYDESYPLPVSWQHVAGVILVVALAIVPLNSGGTRPEGIWLLVGLVGTASLCWIAGLLVDRRVPRASPVLIFGFGCLLLAAIPWLGDFRQPTEVAEFSRIHFAQVAARWPQSVVRNDVGTIVALHASLCLVLWMVADLARDRVWLVVVTMAMVAVGVVITLLAIIQTLPHAPEIYWSKGSAAPGFHWGPFFHHTTAGAYLNTVWPLSAGLAVLSRRWLPVGQSRTIAGLCAGAALILLLGAHATHISRFPQVVALALMPLLLLKLKPFPANLGRRWLAIVAAGVALFAGWFGRTGEIADRWRLLGALPSKAVHPVPPENQWPALVREDLLIPNRYNAGTFGDRGEAQLTAWRAIRARPFTGHGPGNWLGAASKFSSDPYVRSFYLYLQFAHEDFLQAWVESGFPGFVSLVCLLAGGVLVAIRHSPMSIAAGHNLLPFAAALGLAAVLLQSLLDFPLQIPAVALNVHVLAGLCWSLVHPVSPTLALTT